MRPHSRPEAETLMEKKTIGDLPADAFEGRRILVRVDFNVPIEDGRVADDTRIRETLPTLEYLVARGGRVILMSHLGRPKGKWNDEFTLAPVADRLRELIAAPVSFVRDVAGADAHAAVDALQPGHILLLENLRFLAGEEANDRKLAETLAAFGD